MFVKSHTFTYICAICKLHKILHRADMIQSIKLFSFSKLSQRGVGAARRNSLTFLLLIFTDVFHMPWHSFYQDILQDIGILHGIVLEYFYPQILTTFDI